MKVLFIVNRYFSLVAQCGTALLQPVFPTAIFVGTDANLTLLTQNIIVTYRREYCTQAQIVGDLNR